MQNTENVNTNPNELPVTRMNPEITWDKALGVEGSDKPNPAESTVVNKEVNEVQPPVVKPDADFAKKSNIAFIKMRQERAELKRKIAELEKVTSAAAPAQAGLTSNIDRDSIKAEVLAELRNQELTKDRDLKRERAYETLATNEDIMSVPTGIIDVMELVDSDARLSRLNEVDPELALSEAVKVWKERKGLSPSVIPTSTNHVAKKGTVNNLQSVLNKLDTLTPGTSEFNKVYAELKALR